jgi:outer membrane lipoprotein-sorting protein
MRLLPKLIGVTLTAAVALGAFAVKADDGPVDLHPAKSVKPAKPAAPDAAPISAADAVKRANAYLDGSAVMTADFVQIGADGKRSEGKLYVQRPGKMRFQYAPPDRLDIVADGRSVAVRDAKLGTQDLYFIGQTPLKFLLSDHIDIARDTKVTDVSNDANAVSITIEDKATFGGSATITLLFDPATFALKQWTVLDSQGLQTVVTLFNVDLTATPDPSLFKIDEQQRMLNSNVR